LRKIPSNEYYQLPPPPVFPYVPIQEEKEIHLRDHLRVLQKRKWMIIALILIPVIFTLIQGFTTKPIYRGTATLQINVDNPQIVDLKEVFAINMWATDYYQTQYKILESHSLAKRVIQKMKLWEHPEFLSSPPSPFEKWKSSVQSTLLNSIRSLFSFAGPKPPPSSQSTLDFVEKVSDDEKEVPLVGQFISRLKIEPIKESRLVKVHFDSYFPELSTRVPNLLAKEFIQMNLESRLDTKEQAKEWLTKQLDDLRSRVESSDEALQKFGSQNDIFSLDDKENITLNRLNELNEALAKSESERMSKEAIYKQISSEKGFKAVALPSILENKLIQELKQNYIQLETQYTKLSETFKPHHPEIIRLKNQMETVEKSLNLETAKIIAGMKNEYESSLRKESLIRNAFAEQKHQAMAMQQKSIQYNILKREAETNKELYKNLLQRVKELGISAGFHGSNIQIVDYSEKPKGPYKPYHQRKVLLAAVIGLFLGIGFTFLLEYFDNTVKTPEEVDQRFQLPFLGSVPEISCEKRNQLSDRRSSSRPFLPVELVMCNQPRSILAEAYRNIRTSLLLSFSERPPQRILVTSPSPLQGKTTTLINTAISLSQTGARVLIIDGDMRKPRIHKVFGDRNRLGLSDCLSGGAELTSVIRKSEIKNIYYIPAGPIPPNPSELLGSALFREMMQVLSQRFDHILIDAPPVLGFADSIVLSSAVDGVILVILFGKTQKMVLQRAKDGLLNANAKILGVVINRVNMDLNGYKDYYGPYHYYYGEEGKRKELPYAGGRRAFS
jgi:capsular exopolysaccharide synthesis family protein